jgi:SAM-dependent methyltransferase
MEALLQSCTRDDALPIIARHFSVGSRLLEAGCGAGRWVRFLTDRGYRIVGLEYAHDTVRMVRSVWPDLEVVQGDCSMAPFETGAFDGVLSFGVIEHFIEGPRAPLQEIFRVLAPGGKALITVPCQTLLRRIKHKLWWNEIAQSPRALAGRLLTGKSKRLARADKRHLFPAVPAWGDFFEYRLAPTQFAAAVTDVGFTIEEHLPIGTMDGIYHELDPFGLLVKWRNWKLEPTRVATLVDEVLSRRPFLHCHMQAIVARKPVQ